MDQTDTITKEYAPSTAFPSSTRLLLPFTHGVDAQALEFAVALAKGRNAILVPFSLIYVPPSTKGARLERIQQSKDFLALIHSKAARHGVAVECQEVYTGDVIQSIYHMTQKLHCNNIILFVCEGDGVLLSTSEVKHILTGVSGQHHLIQLHRATPRFSINPFKRFARMLTRQQKVLPRSGPDFQKSIEQTNKLPCF